jgi:hypothetical protein
LLTILTFQGLYGELWRRRDSFTVHTDMAPQLLLEQSIRRELLLRLGGGQPVWRIAAALVERIEAPHNWGRTFHLLTLPFTWGRPLGDHRAARRVNHLFTGVLVLSLFAIGRRYGGTSVGLLAALTGAFLPGTLGASLFYGLDYPLTAMLALFVALLLAADGFRRTGASLLAGLSLGLGMLFKLQAGLLAAPLAPAVLVGRGRPRAGALARMAGCLAVAALVSAPWWAAHPRELWRSFLVHATAEPAWGGRAAEVSHAYAPPGSLSWWCFYPLALGLHLSAPLALLLLPALVRFVRRAGSEALLVGMWLGWPLVLGQLIAARSERYILPAVPAAAVILAGAAAGAGSRRRSRLLGAALGLFVVAQALWAAWRLPPWFRWTARALPGQELEVFLHPPRRDNHERVLRGLAAELRVAAPARWGLLVDPRSFRDPVTDLLQDEIIYLLQGTSEDLRVVRFFARGQTRALRRLDPAFLAPSAPLDAVLTLEAAEDSPPGGETAVAGDGRLAGLEWAWSLIRTAAAEAEAALEPRTGRPDRRLRWMRRNLEAIAGYVRATTVRLEPEGLAIFVYRAPSEEATVGAATKPSAAPGERTP